MKTESYVQTNIGAARANNEDNYYCAGTYRKNLRAPTEELLQTPEGDGLLFGVFDGMGGETGGEQASLLCAETLDEIGGWERGFEAPAFYYRANAAVTSYGQSLGSTSGSTAAVAWLRGNRLFASNVGDSRIYHLHDGHLRCLTYDHTRWQQLADAGYTAIEDSERHVLTQFLGMGIRRPMSPHFAVSVRVEKGDRILLCSDGITGVLEDAQLLEALRLPGGTEQAGRRLIRDALDAGSLDNLTVLVVEIAEPDAEEFPLEDAADGPVTRRFDVPTPEQIARQKETEGNSQRVLRRRVLWTLAAMLLLALAILFVALYYGQNRTAAAMVDGRSDVCYNIDIQHAERGMHHVRSCAGTASE